MPSGERVAAIDCGTNSLRLLVTDLDGDSKHDVLREMRIVRLGQDVDRTGRFAPEALERTRQVLGEYASLIETFDVGRTRFCATSAARDASNGDELADLVRETLDVPLEILSGEDEARASFVGATRGRASEPTVVVDIGGGSTELVLGTGDDISWSTSLDVGSVRLTERFLESDPPSVAEVTACESYLDDILTEAIGQIAAVDSLIGVAGTVTTVAAHALALTSYDSELIDGARLSTEELRSACHDLVSRPVADRRTLPFMHPGRADVIGAGALILDRLLDRLDLRTDLVQVSEQDILDGIALMSEAELPEAERPEVATGEGTR